MSDRMAAMITFSSLKDVGIISSANKANVIDVSNVRQKCREIHEKYEESKNVWGLHLGGRNDAIICMKKAW